MEIGDFKTHPELISVVVEDFKKLSHEQAVQQFYQFLKPMEYHYLYRLFQ
jgi:hypothetical protein